MISAKTYLPGKSTQTYMYKNYLFEMIKTVQKQIIMQ